MTAPQSTTTNTADPWSTVGIQAEYVHDSTVYQVLPGATPQKKYEVGVRFLENGVPAKARALIGEAIANDYDTSEVRFHWMLAMLSKRTYRELAHSDLDQLRHIRDVLHLYADGEWTRGLHALCGLLDCQDKPGTDSETALNELFDLDPAQRAQIRRHLDMFLTGAIKDALWANTRDEAKAAQTSNDRLERAWAYFYALPSGPRAREPEALATTTRDWLLIVLSTAVFAAAVGYLGWLMLLRATPLPILAYLLAVASVLLGGRQGLEWRYRTERLHAKEREHSVLRPLRRAPEDGFTDRVDKRFDRYFNKYLPAGADRQEWINGTIGIRNTLRDEVVELYREDRVSDQEISWLIRHMVSDVKKRWQNGTLWSYREQYRIKLVTKALCCLGFTALVPTGVSVLDTAIRTRPLAAALVTLVVVVSGWVAATRWLHIIIELRRYAEELQERDQRLHDRTDAYQRWKKKLEDKKPSEEEMETWLRHDRTMLLDNAIRHYKLAWRDIIGHAFLQTPAKNYKRARAHGGPWRYSRYEIRLFLITTDGVREVSTELDFEKVAFHGQQRTNFRFDAVASVHVTKTDQFRQTLELTLINGPTVTVRVTDSEPGQLEPGEDPQTLSDITLEAAGLAHALHILEGIAAEGQQWIKRDHQANSHLVDVTPAIQGLLT